jgi:NAD(P)-dependent dehydrogenase (short-subunit alcohol dehydrogenase family)
MTEQPKSPQAAYSDLEGRVILVTGGASGIGEAHVRAFCANGAKVAFIDIQEEPGRALAKELSDQGATVCFLNCDLLDIAALDATIETVRRTLGPVFGLINNAAVDQRHTFADLSPAAFEWMMNVNLRHAVFAARAVIPHMSELGAGSIVNTSSVAWMRGVIELELYSATKAALIGFTNSLAREVGPFRIRVNAIAPGHVPTPRQQALWHDAASADQMRTLQCLPDLIKPRDIANAALFLCSDAARMITKHCLTINAGSL